MALIVFLISFLGLLITFFSALKSIAAARWPTVNGEIEFVELDGDQNGLCREPVVTYHYQVGATECVSNRYAFGFMAKFAGLESTEAVNRIIWREPLLVYYHPRKPRLSVLYTGIRVHHIVYGLSFVCLSFVSVLLN